jgi:hypothetical protein
MSCFFTVLTEATTLRRAVVDAWGYLWLGGGSYRKGPQRKYILLRMDTQQPERGVQYFYLDHETNVRDMHSFCRRSFPLCANTDPCSHLGSGIDVSFQGWRGDPMQWPPLHSQSAPMVPSTGAGIRRGLQPVGGGGRRHVPHER